MKIDVNSDMGEGFGVYQLCDDSALMDKVSSANIACGFHAGDPAIMTRMVRLAKVRGVGIGAHPGLPDRQGFGRKEMAFSADEICQQVVYQLGALSAIARAEGTRVVHLSFHAAMGNMINRDDALALQVMQAVARIDSQLIIFCQPDTIIERAAQAADADAVSRRPGLRRSRTTCPARHCRFANQRRSGGARQSTSVSPAGNGDHF